MPIEPNAPDIQAQNLSNDVQEIVDLIAERCQVAPDLAWDLFHWALSGQAAREAIIDDIMNCPSWQI